MTSLGKCSRYQTVLCTDSIQGGCVSPLCFSSSWRTHELPLKLVSGRRYIGELRFIKAVLRHSTPRRLSWSREFICSLFAYNANNFGQIAHFANFGNLGNLNKEALRLCVKNTFFFSSHLCVRNTFSLTTAAPPTATPCVFFALRA